MSYTLAARDSEAFPDPLDGRGADPWAAIVGTSSALSAAVRASRRAARRPGATVLFHGESGTECERFARAIHREGPRQEMPFFGIDCAAVHSEELEAELFGYERGSFTENKTTKAGLLELAESGTVHIGNVGALPIDLQPKLLRTLEERRVRRVGGFDEVEVRCRVTVSTEEPLLRLVEQGAFREDLYNRLIVLRIVVPPLRERGEDIVLLAEHILGEITGARGLPDAGFTPDARAALAGHAWPGNVTELRAVVLAALQSSGGETIGSEHLSFGPTPYLAGSEAAGGASTIAVPASGRSLASVEAELVAITLTQTGWNKAAAARVLGVSRPTLNRKIRDYGILREATS